MTRGGDVGDLQEQADQEFLDAACLALRAQADASPDGAGAGDAAVGGAVDDAPGTRSDPLRELGWFDLLPELGDRDARVAALTLFRAQGRELAGTRALGALLAQPFLAAAGLPPDAAVATISRTSARQGKRLMVVGDVADPAGAIGMAGTALLIDRPGHGAAVVPADEIELWPVAVSGRLELHEVIHGPADWVPTVDEEHAAVARARARFLGRLAAALEILGAAEGALALAVAYARTREQFGRPIGTFQAVRHLLAWAQTDCVALEKVTTAAAALDGVQAAPPRHDEVVKALAGRNGRRVCERALQVLGGIGFTSEHTHHHFHSRVLALDALLGTSAELTHGLGAWLREADDDTTASALWTAPRLPLLPSKS
ncbi:acyl-CoA dehydrogenase family protein [Parafrankia sp. EUN1f]|uniref:acyl-CoA dehydrogenase family protein n=1 Tax=Parafrankia sp. EUN1f TaxID=102897 RepID=UPI0001C45664|nr:acyl-CoA dehydrogenase family protein [Parafrankia sp. EUN1f]EFC82802.1 acyl-CoA dehydrogenase domain protein [Parafrankia sp. EUN1f]